MIEYIIFDKEGENKI